MITHVNIYVVIFCCFNIVLTVGHLSGPNCNKSFGLSYGHFCNLGLHFILFFILSWYTYSFNFYVAC